MARNTSISLTDHFADFIDQQVDTGNYESSTDVVQAGLAMLEEHQAKVRALENALAEGEQGPFSPFDPEDFLKEMHQKYGR